MKITFAVAGAAVSVFARSTVTGQDGNEVQIGDGETGTIELAGGQQLVVSPLGLSTDTGSLIPSAVVETDEADQAEQLVEADAEQIRAIVEGLGDAIGKTQSGAYKVDDVNTALEAAGFAPINAARRDTIWPPA